MGDAMFFRQCKLTKCDTIQIGWIPESFATKGRVVKLRDGDGTWDNGWLVAEVYARRDEKYLPDLHKEIRGHRKNTGDSLPRVG
jgi:hypothetical protein